MNDGTTYAVVVNGAVWKVWDRLADAQAQVGKLCQTYRGLPSRWFEGFDAEGHTAVVRKPNHVAIEALAPGHQSGPKVFSWTETL